MANHGESSATGSGASYGPAAGSEVRMDNSSSAELVAAARNRQSETTFGSDRAIGAVPNWASQASAELYRGATVNNDPASAEVLSQAWNRHSGDLQQAASDLYSAIAELGSVWVGQGAGAAQGTLVGIAGASSQAGEAASSMGTRLAQQAAAAAEVKKMPAPKEFDPAQATTAMLAGGPAAMILDQKKQFDLANDVKSQQVAYFNAYTEAMSQVDGTTPSFGPEALGLPVQVASGGYTGSNVGGLANTASLNPSIMDLGPGAFGATGVGFSYGETDFAGGSAPADQSQTHADGEADTSPGAASTSSGSAAAAGAESGGHSSGAGVGASLGLGAVAGGLGFAASKALSGRRGGNSGSAKFESFKPEQQVRQGNQTAAAANEPSSAPAAGVAGAEATPLAKPVAPASGPAGSMGAVPPMGMGAPMGGQQIEEDEERTHSSFLIQPDPDSLFGTSETVSSPVLGSWDEDEEPEDKK